MDDREKGTPLTLVADNSPGAVEQRRAQQEAERSESRATDAIRRLAINLLRIIAGAGEPGALLRDIDEARTAYLDYLSAGEKAGYPDESPTGRLHLDHLFSWEGREHEPVTEEDWRRWAQPSNPHEEYLKDKARAKLELRRAALRQVASVLSSGASREPRLKAHGGDFEEIIRSIVAAERRLQQQKLLPPRQPDPERRAIAERKTADLRREQRIHQLKSLPAHQIAGLRAVEAGTVDQIDGFTLDVLGRTTLLTRPKGSKAKSAWVLTDDGRLALKIHE